MSLPPHLQLKSLLVCFCCYPLPCAFLTLLLLLCLCCLGLSHPIKNVSGRLLSRCLSSQVLHPQVHALSQTDSCNLFLSYLVFLLHIILSSSTLLNLAGPPGFTSYTISASRNRTMIWNTTRPGTQPNTLKKKKSSGCGKKVQKWVWVERGHIVTISHQQHWNSVSSRSSVNALRCVNARESSETRPPNHPGTGKDKRTQGIKDAISTKRKLNHEFINAFGVLSLATWQLCNPSSRGTTQSSNWKFR